MTKNKKVEPVSNNERKRAKLTDWLCVESKPFNVSGTTINKKDLGDIFSESANSPIENFKEKKKKKWVGAHVSMAGGIFKSVYNAIKINGVSFALFLKSPRSSNSRELTTCEVSDFHKACAKYGFNGNQILPHGSYFINLGNPDKIKWEKSLGIFMDDVKRCEKLGIHLYNFHPGSTVGKCDIGPSIMQIANSINMVIKETKNVTILLENMAGQGHVIGRNFKELKDIIDLVDDKERVGVCLDTCHLFASGYDIRTKAGCVQVLEEFENTIGIKYLKAMHLNDSKAALGSHKDLHESIGKGHIGIECFGFIMNDERFDHIPLVLETPNEENYLNEIKLLYFLMDHPLYSNI